MSLFHRISKRFGSGRKAAPDARLEIRNATRHVTLARSVEVADHGRTRSKGLLGRDGLGEGEGLWILPCEAVHTFGMRFPIDLVYLDRNRRVRKVRNSVPPWRMSACLSAHSVLELASGTVLATGTKAGDTLEIFAAAPPASAPPGTELAATESAAVAAGKSVLT